MNKILEQLNLVSNEGEIVDAGFMKVPIQCNSSEEKNQFTDLNDQ